MIASEACILVQELIRQYFLLVFVIAHVGARHSLKRKRSNPNPQSYSMIRRIPDQVKHLNRIINMSDTDCINNLRMDRNTFHKLCLLLRDLGGLVDGRYVTVEEQVASFLGILAHHKKNRIMGFDYNRSGQTISRYVHKVLKAILKLHNILLVSPQPVRDDSTDARWKWFKGCLGALDGTYIHVQVSSADKPRYRTRKGQIATNTLAVCDRHLRFVYILPGWEGSAGDSRILRDAVTRENGFKVPQGMYYLCDNAYANIDGFLTPYKGVRYHLKEWGPTSQTPQNPKEIFNMRHTRARNVSRPEAVIGFPTLGDQFLQRCKQDLLFLLSPSASSLLFFLSSRTSNACCGVGQNIKLQLNGAEQSHAIKGKKKEDFDTTSLCHCIFNYLKSPNQTYSKRIFVQYSG